MKRSPSARNRASRPSRGARDRLSRNGTVRAETSCMSRCLRRRSISATRWVIGGRLLLGFVVLDKLDADLRSIDPDHFATPKREPGGRQHQEKLLRLEHVRRSFDL